MIKYLTTVIISLPLLCWGQGNLVPNGGFEELVSCPTMPGQVWSTSYWNNPNAASPDYFHSCNLSLVFPPDTIQWPNVGVPSNTFGYQQANSGEAYSGMYCYSFTQGELRDYIQIKLIDSIVPNVRYLVGFYASLADKSQYTINTLGAMTLWSRSE